LWGGQPRSLPQLHSVLNFSTVTNVPPCKNQFDSGSKRAGRPLTAHIIPPAGLHGRGWVSGKSPPIAKIPSVHAARPPRRRQHHDDGPAHESGHWQREIIAHTEFDFVELNREINVGLADSAVRARLTELATEPHELRPAEFSGFIASETNKWAKVVKLSGAKPE
jgi:hypothetical protein